MRDVGTEMTPIPSQDPSRTGTPMGATTPSRSPRSSTPPTHKRGAMAKAHENDCHEKSGKQELSETELKLKTRGEIAALGIQLGKMNIASWASKEVESAAPSHRNFYAEQNAEAEYEARAAAWKEAEKAKHMARYKRDEVKIQAWEDHQKAKIEAKMRKLEVVSVGFVKGREAYNVIPETVEFGGTFRSMTTEALSYLAKRIREVVIQRKGESAGAAPKRSQNVTVAKRQRFPVSEERDEILKCSGKSCSSCVGVLLADCTALSCCPCGVINFLDLAFLKVPWVVGRKCFKALTDRRIEIRTQDRREK